MKKYHPDDLIEYLTDWLKSFANNQELINRTIVLSKQQAWEPKAFGLAFEDLVHDLRGLLGLSYNKLDVEDPKYINDSHHGDFMLRQFEYILCIDTKISIWDNYCGGVSTTSLSNFSGWYLCCSRNLSKVCLIDSDFLRAKVNSNELKTSECPTYYLFKDLESVLQEGIECNAIIIF